MNRKKLLAVVGALVLAIVCTAALVRYVQGAKDRALSGEELVEVLVAKTSIKAGTAAADLVKDVTAEQVQTKVRAADAITSFSQIDGLVTAIDLVAGEQLLSTRFVNPASFQGARSSSVKIPVGANEVTFKLSPERALGGQLRPGDTVTAVASFEPFDNDALNPATGESKSLPKSPNTAHILLNRVVVVRVQFPESAATSSKEKNGVGVAPTEDLLVTLAVDQPSLERAVFAAEFGKVWLSYEPKTADSTQNKEVTRSNVYSPTKSLLIDDTGVTTVPGVVAAAPTTSVAPTTTRKP